MREAWQVASGKCQVTSGKWRVTWIRRRVARHPSPVTVLFALALLFFALGLMSKPMLVTWPFVLLLLDYWPLERMTSDKWRVSSGKLT